MLTVGLQRDVGNELAKVRPCALKPDRARSPFKELIAIDHMASIGSSHHQSVA